MGKPLTYAAVPDETSHQSPITNHQSPITNHQSPITNHQSPITNHQSPLFYQLPMTNHQSPFAFLFVSPRPANLHLSFGKFWRCKSDFFVEAVRVFCS